MRLLIAVLAAMLPAAAQSRLSVKADPRIELIQSRLHSRAARAGDQQGLGSPAAVARIATGVARPC
jgi:hypothetical protein